MLLPTRTKRSRPHSCKTSRFLKPESRNLKASWIGMCWNTTLPKTGSSYLPRT